MDRILDENCFHLKLSLYEAPKLPFEHFDVMFIQPKSIIIEVSPDLIILIELIYHPHYFINN